MSEQHLFRKPPSLELVQKIFRPLGVNICDLPTQFSKEQVDSYKWSEEDLLELIPYYVPSMMSRFFNGMVPRNTLTILRQCVKAHGLEFKTVDCMSSGKKSKQYHIARPTNTILEHPITIRFD